MKRSESKETILSLITLLGIVALTVLMVAAKTTIERYLLNG